MGINIRDALIISADIQVPYMYKFSRDMNFAVLASLQIYPRNLNP